MLKRITVWGAALAAIVVAVLLVMRMGPDGAPDVVDVLEQAPLPLPTGPRETLDELQRQIRLPQEPAGEQSTAEPPAVASDEPELAAAPDGSRRFMFDCGNGVVFARSHGARRSDGVFAADSRRRLPHAAADRSRFWRTIRGRRFGFLEPRRRRDLRDPRSVVRRLHVESRCSAIRRGAPPRCDVPRARQRAVVGARDLAAAAHVDDRARPAPHGVSVPRSHASPVRGRPIALSPARRSSSSPSTACRATTR